MLSGIFFSGFPPGFLSWSAARFLWKFLLGLHKRFFQHSSRNAGNPFGTLPRLPSMIPLGISSAIPSGISFRIHTRIFSGVASGIPPGIRSCIVSEIFCRTRTEIFRDSFSDISQVFFMDFYWNRSQKLFIDSSRDFFVFPGFLQIFLPRLFL